MHVTTHNTMSLDGAVTGFPVDIGLHYASAPEADLHLAGSVTVQSGIEKAGQVPPETTHDRMPSEDGTYWLVPDSTGRLIGMLHVLRRFDGCRDVLVLVSAATPPTYLQYLAQRGYQTHASPGKHVDLAAGLAWATELAGPRVHADGGPGLLGALWNAGLVDHVSLVVAPHVAGPDGLRLFRDVQRPLGLTCREVAQEVGGSVRMLYSARVHP